MEPREFERTNVTRDQGLLLENLRSNENSTFDDLARRALSKPNVNVDFVYPHPIDKTLLEIACCEGRTDFVEILLKLGANANRPNENHNRAPIHFAAENNHPHVLRILLKDPRTNPDLQIGRQTALHVAVRNKNPQCVKILLENGANPNIANSKNLTPIHLAASNDQREIVLLILESSKLPPNIDDFRDFKKRTTREILQNKMPDIELPPMSDRRFDRDDEVAPRSCLVETDEMRFLETLRKIDDSRLTNSDELIEIATKRNFSEVVGELLRRGIDWDAGKFSNVARLAVELGHYRVLEEIFVFDSKIANELLITACKELGVPTSFRRDSEDDRMKCLRLILEQPDVNVRCEDGKGNTPLHYAARAESSQAVQMLLRSGSYIGHKNVLGVPPLAHMSPEILSDFFDDCLRGDNEKTDEYEIEFDYRCLMPHNVDNNYHRGRAEANEEMGISRSSGSNAQPLEMETLAFIASNRALKPLLKHPLLSSFLYLKWHRIRHFLYANITFYVVFYVLINTYILSTNYPNDYANLTQDSFVDSSTTILTKFQQFHGLRSLTAVALILLSIREAVQLFSSPFNYVKSFENLLELCLIFFGGWILIFPDPQIGAIVILLSAWEIVILIGQHPRMSTGIEMFKTVTLNFLKFLFLYAFLILAFALAFFTLFKNYKDDENFPDPGHSLFKTIIMLTGEFDANDIPFVAHPILSHCIFVLFVFLIAIVLFNLLNGLAVSDTAEILNKSELVGLISRTRLVSYAENVAVGSGLVKLTGRCCDERSFRRSKLNPLGFLTKRILLFPEYLPQSKIGVKPYKCNAIRLYGRSRKIRTCVNWSMDPTIVGRAREILNRRGEITENEKMIGELDTIKRKLERMENVMDGIRLALENNNS